MPRLEAVGTWERLALLKERMTSMLNLFKACAEVEGGKFVPISLLCGNEED